MTLSTMSMDGLKEQRQLMVIGFLSLVSIKEGGMTVKLGASCLIFWPVF